MPDLRVAADLTLPLNTVTSTLLVLGGKGMGKSTFGSVEAEEFKLAGLRFAVIDPLGVWWGLRHSANGKKPGFEVLILGGIHGDLPIEPTAGAVVADLVADEEVDVIIDISRRPNGKLWSQGERIRFVTAYCTRLFERQGERRRAMHQFIDEAGRFVPQNYPAGDHDIPLCIGAIEQLVEWGRNVGVGVTLLTQRSARINKSVSELADCLVAFRTVGPRSIAAIMDWFGEHIPKERSRDLVEQLRQLPVGTALIVSPGWLRFEGQAHIRPRQTFDSSATPEPGAAPATPSGKAAKPDLAKYQALMAATIEKAKADDPRELRKRIAELERAAAARNAPDVTALKQRLSDAQQRIAELEQTPRLVPAFTDEAVVALQRALAMANTATSGLTSAAQQIEISLRPLQAALEQAQRPVPTPPPPPRQPVPRIDPVPAEHRRPATANTPAPRPERTPAPVSGPAAQRIIDALARFEAAGMTAVPRAHAAVMAGYAHDESRPFREAVTQLAADGKIVFPTGGTIGLTDDGREETTVTVDPLTLDELHAAWCAAVRPPRDRLLRFLIEHYGEDFGRRELAQAVGYAHEESRPFREGVSLLAKRDLLTYPSGGRVAVSPLLFPNELAQSR